MVKLKEKVLTGTEVRRTGPITCVVNGLISLERTLTQGSDSSHGSTQNNLHGFHKALGVGK